MKSRDHKAAEGKVPPRSQPAWEIPDGSVLEALNASDLGDPLSDVTRAERKSLLGVSLLALAVSAGELIPTNIAALGLEVHPNEQAGLLLILGLVQAYFLSAFVFYGLSDLNSWRLRIRLYSKKLRAIFGPLRLNALKFDQASPEEWDRLERLGALREETDLAKELMLGSKARVAFEFGVPILFGLASLLILLDSYSEKASLGPWKALLGLPWSLVPLLLVCGLLVGVWWRWHRKKTQPVRSARRTSDRLARLTEKMKQAGKLAPDDPARKVLMDEINQELKSIGTRGKGDAK